MNSLKSSPPSEKTGTITPRIIIHGGAGNLTRKTISQEKYAAYESSLRRILASSSELLFRPGAKALDVATHAVSLLEDDSLYNSAKGAVFTSAGKNELECSIMTSNGYRKRGVGCMLLEHVRNPIKLARELLIRGEEGEHCVAKDHCQYSGEFVETLARNWGLEMVDPSYYFTQSRWDEHKRGLEEQKKLKEKEVISTPEEMSDWEKNNYIPLGTCGAVVVDSFGTVCTATSTGGLTNKAPGRIGDTPTMGAGFWAEEWLDEVNLSKSQMLYQPCAVSPIDKLSKGDVKSFIGDCLPSNFIIPQILSTFIPPKTQSYENVKPVQVRHAVGISSTGNGDTFLRLAGSTTAVSKSRFTPCTLSQALTWMAGPGGELQQSAGDRWGRVHEGVGGMIGIELVGSTVNVVHDYNCGGMIRAWTDGNGKHKFLIFRKEGWENGPEE